MFMFERVPYNPELAMIIYICLFVSTVAVIIWIFGNWLINKLKR